MARNNIFLPEIPYLVAGGAYLLCGSCLGKEEILLINFVTSAGYIRIDTIPLLCTILNRYFTRKPRSAKVEIRAQGAMTSPVPGGLYLLTSKGGHRRKLAEIGMRNKAGARKADHELVVDVEL